MVKSILTPVLKSWKQQSILFDGTINHVDLSSPSNVTYKQTNIQIMLHNPTSWVFFWYKGGIRGSLGIGWSLWIGATRTPGLSSHKQSARCYTCCPMRPTHSHCGRGHPAPPHRGAAGHKYQSGVEKEEENNITINVNLYNECINLIYSQCISYTYHGRNQHWEGNPKYNKDPHPHPQFRSLSMQKIGLASWVSGRFGMSAPLNAPQGVEKEHCECRIDIESSDRA